MNFNFIKNKKISFGLLVASLFALGIGLTLVFFAVIHYRYQQELRLEEERRLEESYIEHLIEESLVLEVSIAEEQAKETLVLNVIEERKAAKEKYKEEVFQKFLDRVRAVGLSEKEVSVVWTKNNELIFAYQEDKVMTAASSVKTAFAMGLMDRIERGERRLTDVVELKEEDYENGAGKITNTFKVGDKYTLAELLYETLVTSDNTAFHALNRNMYAQNAYNQSYIDFPMEEYIVGNKIQANIAMAILERLHAVKHYALIRDYLSQATLTYGLVESMRTGELAYGKQGYLTGTIYALIGAWGKEGTEGVNLEPQRLKQAVEQKLQAEGLSMEDESLNALLEEKGFSLQTPMVLASPTNTNQELADQSEDKALDTVDNKISIYLNAPSESVLRNLVAFFIEESRFLDEQEDFTFYGPSYQERVRLGEIKEPEVYRP